MDTDKIFESYRRAVDTVDGRQSADPNRLRYKINLKLERKAERGSRRSSFLRFAGTAATFCVVLIAVFAIIRFVGPQGAPVDTGVPPVGSGGTESTTEDTSTPPYNPPYFLMDVEPYLDLMKENRPTEDEIESIKVGMSVSEVVEMIGKPHFIDNIDKPQPSIPIMWSTDKGDIYSILFSLPDNRDYNAMSTMLKSGVVSAEPDKKSHAATPGIQEFNALITKLTDTYFVFPYSDSSYYCRVYCDTAGFGLKVNDRVIVTGEVSPLESFSAENIKNEYVYSYEFTADVLYEIKTPVNISYENSTVEMTIVKIAETYFIGGAWSSRTSSVKYYRVPYSCKNNGFCIGNYVRVSGRHELLSPAENDHSEIFYVDAKPGDPISVTAVIYDAKVESESVGTISPEKPVIYLYPEVKTNIRVGLELDGRLTCTYPAYANGGWNVTALPDGTLYDESRNEYYCLYWEGISTRYTNPDRSTGFIVPGEKTAEFLREKLALLGLTPREANEFIIYWLPQMQNNAYNYINFAGKEYANAAVLTVTPRPDTMIRVMMLWEPLAAPYEITEQQLTSVTRKGFTLVEWGGAKLSR